jgi:hypothetical protein
MVFRGGGLAAVYKCFESGHKVLAPTEVRCEFLKSSFFVVAVFL